GEGYDAVRREGATEYGCIRLGEQSLDSGCRHGSVLDAARKIELVFTIITPADRRACSERTGNAADEHARASRYPARLVPSPPRQTRELNRSAVRAQLTVGVVIH